MCGALILLWACTTPTRAPSPAASPPGSIVATASTASTGTPDSPASIAHLQPHQPCDAPPGPRHFDTLELGASRPGDVFGYGIATADFDGDGRIDIAAATHHGVELFFQSIDGWTAAPQTFTGIDLQRAVGLSAADYDGDGDPDLFITRHALRNRLLRNDGAGFTDVSAAAGIIDNNLHSASASWGDLDRDGDLDLWVGNYGDFVPNIAATQVAPGDPSVLYRNNGDGTFTDISQRLPAEVQDSHLFMTAFYDLEGDGFPELFSVADFGWLRPSRLIWNHTGVLELDDGSAGFHANFAGMGLGVGDLNGDGLPDFVQSSYANASVLESGPWQADISWAEFSQVRGVQVEPSRRQVFGWGVAVGDLDNDRDLDILMGFGRWPEYVNTKGQRDALWIREGEGFHQAADLVEWQLDDPKRTRGLVLVDLNRDGYLDVVRRRVGEPVLVDLSRCRSGHWSEVRLQDLHPNRAAIGARVQLAAAGQVFTRWIEAGSSSMFSSGVPVAHFGLGSIDRVDRIDVRWPDGQTTTLHDLPADRRMTIERLPSSL